MNVVRGGSNPFASEPGAARPSSASNMQPSLAMGAHFFHVRELVAYIRELFASDPILGDVWISGEIADVSVSAAGHAYFTIRDEEARIPAVMFRSAARRQTLPLIAGYQALVHGTVGIYDQRSIFQVVADIVLPGDAGKLRAQFEALRLRLEQEGLFAPDRKRPIPQIPRRIGLVTSETGAVIHDMLNVWQRRYRNLELVLAPSLVQGDAAPRQIVTALRRLDAFHQSRAPLDLIILARGGGSPEELAVFNDEAVARAIFAASVPVVSAIGHEVDVTIADLVADLRAPTPSAAAEMVVPDAAELRRAVARLQESFLATLQRRVATARADVETILHRLGMSSPARTLENGRRAVDEIVARAARAVSATIERARAHVARSEAQLAGLNPEMTLRRGYAVCSRPADNAVVTDAAQLALGDRMSVRFARGRAEGEVLELETSAAGVGVEEQHGA
ncbi:MAG: exodeoxyribonuclease VII large subunit [Chloroflexi bacterium]|nr:exodeoxyribonuclease VII large subunit [Chloroflexota bacterium]